MSKAAASPALTLTRSRPYNPTPKLVKMTPKLAEEILERNTLNRPLRSGRVERYAADMKSGNWKLNGETIKITEDGQLLDGQHRLFAVMDAKITVEMMVVEGLDASVMPTIDTGAARTFGDVLGIGGGKNTTMAASVYRWLAWSASGDKAPGGPSGLTITHSELMKVAEQHTDVPARVSEIASSKAKRIIAPSILAFVYTLAHRIDPAKAGAFIELLGSGANMDAKHPIFQLRERMLQNAAAKAKLRPIDVCALAIKAWNHFVTGKRTNTLVWKVTEDFPKMLRGNRA